MKRTIAMACALAALGTMAEVAFTDVLLRQRWPWSAKIDVYYTVKGVDELMGVRPVFTAGGETLAAPEASLSGDRAVSRDGCYRLTWNPEAANLGREKLDRLAVTLTASAAPLYMVVDLAKARDADGQVVYVWEDDLRSGKWGAWEENPYSYIYSVIWTGVTEDMLYKTNSLVLRYIPPTTSAAWKAHTGGADTFLMGAPEGTPNGQNASTEGQANVEAHIAEVSVVSRCQPQQTVRLTKGYWMGVFEVTQGQWCLMGLENPSYWTAEREARPVEKLSLAELRGSAANLSWPGNGHAVDPASFLGLLRAKTGIQFDLPTEAQWEFAARAGATGIRYGEQTYDGLKATARCWWQRWNYTNPAGGPANGGPALVGSYRPNAWGLYDTLGNVAERCLNGWVPSAACYSAETDGGDDPAGRTPSSEYRCAVFRGGEFYNYIDRCTLPGRRTFEGDASKYGYEGFRLCAE